MSRQNPLCFSTFLTLLTAGTLLLAACNRQQPAPPGPPAQSEQPAAGAPSTPPSSGGTAAQTNTQPSMAQNCDMSKMDMSNMTPEQRQKMTDECMKRNTPGPGGAPAEQPQSPPPQQ